MGGGSHPRLNTGVETDSKAKYREGKVKSTLEREAKKGVKSLRRNGTADTQEVGRIPGASPWTRLSPQGLGRTRYVPRSWCNPE